MKTAIQELQEWMSENHFKVTFAFLDQLEYCKQKEKEQMLNFYMWMRMNENAEKYLDYSDEDMFSEYLNQKQ
jgi:hypothetical protein